MAWLISWRKKEFGGRDKNVKELMGKLKQAKERHDQYNRGNEIRSIEKHIQRILMDEEVY